MKKLIRNISLLISLGYLSACATPPQTIHLDPQPTIASSSIGSGQTVAVQVTDARPQTLTATYAAAKIDPNQDVVGIFTQQINQGLRQNNFVPVTDNAITANSTLQVKIMLLNYSSAEGFVSANSKTQTEISVTAYNNKSGTLTKTYRTSNYSDAYLTANNINGSEQVNAAVTQLLNNMFHDQNLLQFLATPASS